MTDRHRKDRERSTRRTLLQQLKIYQSTVKAALASSRLTDELRPWYQNKLVGVNARIERERAAPSAITSIQKQEEVRDDLALWVVAVDALLAAEMAFKEWNKITQLMLGVSSEHVKFAQLEQVEGEALQEFLISHDVRDVAAAAAGLPTSRQPSRVWRAPLYLVDHLRTKADAPLRVIVGALMTLGHDPATIKKVVSAARRKPVDGAQLRRLARSLRARGASEE